MQQKVNKLSHKVKKITEREKQQTDVCLIASQIHFKDRYQCLHGGALSILMFHVLLITSLSPAKFSCNDTKASI